MHRRSRFQYKRINMAGLEVQIGDLKFKNPVTTASGTFGYGTEY
jgi:dihydroorotate dehydrogenase